MIWGKGSFDDSKLLRKGSRRIAEFRKESFFA